MRALISSIPATARGGVPALARVARRFLTERNIQTDIAWYEPYRMTPRLSVPSFRLGTRRPGAEARDVDGAFAGHAIGAWLPELEFTHYWPTPLWRERIAAADLHLVVSGTAMAGLAYQRTATPFLAWVASDWEGDRRDRVACFPAPRRWLDRIVVRPVCRRLERRILRAGSILALSEATREALDRVAGASVVAARLPAPVDVERFRPTPGRVVANRVGLVGRFDDPRKNVALFLRALAAARNAGVELTGELIGAPADASLRREIDRLGLSGAVEVAGELSPAGYVERLSALDVLAVTSHQEGLHIAALEAMACGCPVVSTRCGGPEEFVETEVNGLLCDAEPEAFARALARVAGDRELRGRFSAAARRGVEAGYSWPRVRARFDAELDRFLRARGRSAAARREGEAE